MPTITAKVCSKCGGSLHMGSVNGGPRALMCTAGHPATHEGHVPVRRNKPAPGLEELGTDLERLFVTNWRMLASEAPEYTSEYVFHETRGWRIDFAWPLYRVAVEVEGFGHGLESRYHGDVEKYNMLTNMSWKLFRCTRRMLTNDPAGFINMVKEHLI